MLALDLYPEVVRDFFSPEDWERIAAALQSPGRDEVCPGRLLASLAWIFERQPQEIFGPNLPEKPPTPEYRRTHAALKKQAEKVKHRETLRNGGKGDDTHIEIRLPDLLSVCSKAEILARLDFRKTNGRWIVCIAKPEPAKELDPTKDKAAPQPAVDEAA